MVQRIVTRAGVYVHIPFCERKCGYCDFNAYSGYKDGTKARYVDALRREIASRAEPDTPVPSVFFGGGTPTSLSVSDLSRILETLRESFALEADAEVSVEANPSDVSPAYLEGLRAAGFTRLSFGVQTFNDRILKLIDRTHTADEARAAVSAARAAGFDNVSFDLMFGLPRQTLADWERTLEAAIALGAPHLSMYGLTVEEGTPFWARRERGRLTLPGEGLQASMFARAMERAAAAGYVRYEISNHARPGYACRHNQIYWRNEEYFGFGAGAAGYRGGVRSVNERRPSRYIERVQAEGGPVFAESERLEARAAMGETAMLGLRLAEGLDLEAFAARFGVRAQDVFAREIARVVDRGWAVCAAGRLRLTERGVMLASEAMAEFV